MKRQKEAKRIFWPIAGGFRGLRGEMRADDVEGRLIKKKHQMPIYISHGMSWLAPQYKYLFQAFPPPYYYLKFPCYIATLNQINGK